MTEVQLSLYQRVLIFLRDRKRAYAAAFGGPAGRAVLEDLAVFCMATTSTFDKDPHVQSALNGRREVWLRIQQHLGMTPEELAELYHGARQRAIKGD